MIRQDGCYVTVTFEEAFRLMAKHLGGLSENDCLVMTSGNYSNEELYMMQRLARAGLHTNALGSFDYYRRGTSFFIDKNDIVPFAELFSSGYFFCMFDDKVQAPSQDFARKVVESSIDTPHYFFNTPETLNIVDYAAFFRSVNGYLIRHDLAKGIYVNGLGKNYDEYEKHIFENDYDALLAANRLKDGDIASFATLLLGAQAPVFLVWERLLNARGVIELENLCMLLDIQAKPASGFLCLKAELNSQGLHDMGIFPDVCVGGRPMDENSRQLLHDICQKEVTTSPVDIPARLCKHDFQGCLVFNSTGASMPAEVLEQVKNSTFSVLHTAHWDGVSSDFDVLLPAALPDEVHGTFTDSTRVPHSSLPAANNPLPLDNLQQLSRIGELLGLSPLEDSSRIFLEYASFFQGGCRSELRHFFR